MAWLPVSLVRRHVIRNGIGNRRPDRVWPRYQRGAIPGTGTFLGGVLCAMPFLVPYEATTLP
jgi:hypothetical protein